MRNMKTLTLAGAMALAFTGCANQEDVQQSSRAATIPAGALGVALAAKASATVFVVRLNGKPMVAYEGGMVGLPATKPGPGQKLNPKSSASMKYKRHLSDSHNAAMAAVGAAKTKKLYSYSFAVDGFAAELSPAQATQLAALPNVVSVEPDVMYTTTTESSPDFLGLRGAGGLWEQVGGMDVAGEDVIIGVIDTGIWPEHPSFSDQLDLSDPAGNSGFQNLAYGAPPSDWHGRCQAGEQFSKDDCNNKLIGARYYLEGFKHQGVITQDYLSARDADGHGSHTASTAGGNADVPASVMGIDLGELSGMAPRARIASYKVCWNDQGCAGSDLTKAIDDAVGDGVDVINYSIGGGAGVLSAQEISFLFAADAGVFVATSAGNSGPDAQTVGSPAVKPWVTAVGASTEDTGYEGTIDLGDGSSFSGASLTLGTGNLPMVDSANAGSELCIPGELNPAVVADKIVLCKRGAIARVDKSRAVAIAGGAGMVLYNADPGGSLVADAHFVPSVHVSDVDGPLIKAYIASAAAANGTLSGGQLVSTNGPNMAGFSSRGWNAITPDIIKPDVTAPGVDIFAAGTPSPMFGAGGELFMAASGTSMSSPHVAGVGALLKQAHPDWSPAMIKSSLMTTGSADVRKEDGVTLADPFDIGAGHIVPVNAVNPGLVYDSNWVDDYRFICSVIPGMISDGDCDFLDLSGWSMSVAGGRLDPSQYNLASIGIAGLAGTETIVRTVTNVGDSAANYTAIIEAPAGVNVSVTPAALNIPAGASTQFAVTFTVNPSAAMNTWAFGALTWTDGEHSARSPLAVRPMRIAAPGEVSGSAVTGSLSYDATFGFNSNDFQAAAAGLVPAQQQAEVVVDDPANDINTALGTNVGITWHEVVVEPGAIAARFSLFDAYTSGNDDLDLYVFSPAWGFVGGSGSGTSAEQVDVRNDDLSAIPAGTYHVAVHGWQTDGVSSNYTLFSWGIQPTAEGNMTVSAQTTTSLAETGTVDVSWTGLEAGQKYMGAVTYTDSGDLFGGTAVRIDTD